MIECGDIVTWGSGEPRARVRDIRFGEATDGKRVGEAIVVLTAEQAGCRWQVFPIGSVARFPVDVLTKVGCA